jgi:hypothetical protein
MPKEELCCFSSSHSYLEDVIEVSNVRLDEGLFE